MFDVLILNARQKDHPEILFKGQAKSICLPGAEGEFEILDYHKPIMSRLKKGVIVVDNVTELSIKDGIIKMDRQKFVAIVETEKQ